MTTFLDERDTMAIHGACRDHPFLDPDAWFEVLQGKPQRTGAEAALVCRFSCSFRDSCPMPPFPSMIAGGGWYDTRTNYRPYDPEVMEMHQAAAYIGIPVSKLQDLATSRKLARPPELKTGWLYFTDVEILAEKFSPEHGTQAMWRLHQLRGQRPCSKCVSWATA